MKTKPNVLTAFGATTLLGLALATAQDGGPPRDGGAGRLQEMIKRADTNSDGKISKEEFVTARKAELEEQFGRLDANGDGQADEAEMQQMASRARDGAGRRPEGGDGGFRRPGEGGPEGGFRRPPEGEGERRPEGDGGPRREGAGGPPPGGPGGPQGGPGGRGGQMMAGMGALFQLMSPEGFSKIDANADGSIDVEEFKKSVADQAAQGFGRIDGNSDGKLTQDELRQAGERMRNMMGGRGPGGPGGPPGGEGGFRRPGGAEGGERGGFRRPPSEGDGAPKPDEKKDGV
ncbi:MAG: EF-hand domain-containing protein [Verrucomicrobiaceae bacterium]|nr:EF-hand domain-containing protein [Verrucomicrobiaceae bacterium]